jgi:hypothetical protein
MSKTNFSDCTTDSRQHEIQVALPESRAVPQTRTRPWNCSSYPSALTSKLIGAYASQPSRSFTNWIR